MFEVRRSARRICVGVVMMVAIPLSDAPAQELPAWCPALRDVVALVRAKDRFASIIGRQRNGNFSDTTLPLPGWRPFHPPDKCADRDL
jgi:hypothetical protein